jgi:hypothetical protein
LGGGSSTVAFGGNKNGTTHHSETNHPMIKKSDKVTTLNTLEKIAEAGELSCVASKSEFLIFRELEVSNYIVGQIGPDTHDAPETMLEDVTITTQGRLLMERLRKSVDEKTLRIRFIKIASHGFALIAGGAVKPLWGYVETLILK